MTEIRYIEGLYAMWDELLRRHPGLAIDNCASGGRRMDLDRSGEARRCGGPIGRRTLSIASATPSACSPGSAQYVGRGRDDQGQRIRMAQRHDAGMNVKLPEQDDEESARYAKAAIEQYLSIQRFYYGDYYQLTQYSQAKDVWMAYQLDLPETGEGLIVALKRPESKDGGRR